MGDRLKGIMRFCSFRNKSKQTKELKRKLTKELSLFGCVLFSSPFAVIKFEANEHGLGGTRA